MMLNQVSDKEANEVKISSSVAPPSESDQIDTTKPRRIKDRVQPDDYNGEPTEDDLDPRFLHIMANDAGADLKRKFFKNTTGEYLMAKCK